MLDCASDNIGSDKTMQALGGILDREEIDPADGLLTKVYYFDVNDCIEKYKDVYGRSIINNDNFNKGSEASGYNRGKKFKKRI